MSYKNLIDKNIISAFRLIKDLAVDATIVKKTVNEYNFSTANLNAVAVFLPVKVILLDSAQKSEKHNTEVKRVFIKKTDVDKLDAYERLIVNDVQWKIGPKIAGDDFIMLAEIYREA
jgi:hypothetical protein